MKDATLHSSTYNGYGEEIISAIEVLNILKDENLVENSANQGKYLLNELKNLELEYPIIKDVRGLGLLCCIRFENISAKLAKLIPGEASKTVISKLTTGGIINQLFEKHNILSYTPPHDFDLLFLTPPLTIQKEEIDELINALKEVLKTNVLDHSKGFLKKYVQNY